MKRIIIGENEAGQRTDKYLKKLLCNAPSGFIYKMLRKKNILLNKKKANGNEKLEKKDEILLFLSDETYDKFTVNVEELKYPKGNLSIVYEDDDLLIIDKPAGMLSQKAAKDDVSANEYMIRYLLDLKVITKEDLAAFKPSICNRLDRNTSGLLIGGKTLKGLQETAIQLKNREIEKYYLCIVKGIIHEKKQIKGWLVKNKDENKVTIAENEIKDSQYIETFYEPIERYKCNMDQREYTLLKVHLITGRSHQIRAHLSSICHPIIGDLKYGDKKVNQLFRKHTNISYQLLHAYQLKLKNGTWITAPMNKVFEKVIQMMSEYEEDHV